jgi:hypothetical protein
MSLGHGRSNAFSGITYHVASVCLRIARRPPIALDLRIWRSILPPAAITLASISSRASLDSCSRRRALNPGGARKKLPVRRASKADTRTVSHAPKTVYASCLAAREKRGLPRICAQAIGGR